MHYRLNYAMLYQASAALLFIAALMGIAIYLDSGRALAGEIKFLTYNVWGPGWNKERGDKVIEVIEGQQADVIGLQEILYSDRDDMGDRISGAIPGISGGFPDVRVDIEASLSGSYDIYFRDTFDPILIRKTAGLRLISQGSTQLYECRVPSQLNWLKLEEKDSGKEFIFYNSHYCPAGMEFGPDELDAEKRNQWHGSQTVELMAAHQSENVIQILAGDLNAGKASNTINYLIAGQALPVSNEVSPISLVDSWAIAPGNEGDKPSTHVPQAEGQTVLRSIDWIIASPSVEVITAGVVQSDLTAVASDHYPVSALIQF